MAARCGWKWTFHWAGGWNLSRKKRWVHTSCQEPLSASLSPQPFPSRGSQSKLQRQVLQAPRQAGPCLVTLLNQLPNIQDLLVSSGVEKMLLEQNFLKVAHKINRGETVSLVMIRAGAKPFYEWSKASFFPLCTGPFFFAWTMFTIAQSIWPIPKKHSHGP